MLVSLSSSFLLFYCVCVGCEDALIHLLNHVWPNVFEESAHVIAAVMEAIEAMMIAGEIEPLHLSSTYQYR